MIKYLLLILFSIDFEYIIDSFFGFHFDLCLVCLPLFDKFSFPFLESVYFIIELLCLFLTSYLILSGSIQRKIIPLPQMPTF